MPGLREVIGKTACALLAAGALAAPAAAQSLAHRESAPRAHPGNLLVIVADDLGADNLAVYGIGVDFPQTPVIDSLAATGMLFRNAWSSPRCSPSRAMLQTGRYGFRTGIGDIVRDGDFALQLAEITLPEMLDQGTGGRYAHALFGKWHLGNGSVGGFNSPNLAGWSHFQGSMGNLGASYFNWTKVENGRSQQVQAYATTDTVDDALAWIATAPEPWLCMVNFNAPHAPLHIPPDELHSVDFSQNDTPRLRYLAMIEAMDTEMGRLLAGMGPLRGRTNVFFLGDNGTADFAQHPSTPPEQSKWHLYQGGVHVPLIVTGPAVEVPGSECAALTDLSDLFATVAELAGVDLVGTLPAGLAVDSVSIAPYLRDPARPSIRKGIYAELFENNGYGPYLLYAASATDGAYKLILSRHYFRHPKPEELFDLRADPGERNDLLVAGPLSAEAQAAYDKLQRWIAEYRE